MGKMDDAKWFVQRCLVLEHIIKNVIPQNYSPEEKSSVFATMLKNELELTGIPEKAKEHFVNFLLSKDK